MKIFIEGENYSIKILNNVFGNKFYIPINTNEGVINYIGYHYNNDIISFILPKIFINDSGKVFSKYDKLELVNKNIYNLINDKNKTIWFKKFIITFYKSLIEYKNRHKYSNLLSKEITLQLNNLYGNNEFSYLDLVLSYLNFHKKNKNILIFIYKENISNKYKKIKWEKTVKRTFPLIINRKTPIYSEKVIKQKYINDEELILKLFYSILYHFKIEYNLNISIEDTFKIVKGKEFDNLCRKANILLKKVKYKYFSDTLLKLYKLLEIYFNQYNQISYKNTKEEFLTVKNYNIVFEDMIDKIFSDEISDLSTSKNITLKKLKNQKDGKLVDHLFKYYSIIDKEESIFYIGDSKYYKTDNIIGGHSIYKQFTYAKNIIQFNIDLINEDKEIGDNIKYRDEISEGYNITPNYFIQGIIYPDFNFKKPCLEIDNYKGENGIEISFHFKNRLFDRDTLFIYYYTINYLFVLESYIKSNSVIISKLRKEIRKTFRKNFIEYFKNNEDLDFYSKSFDNIDCLKNFVNENFKILNGKIYRTNNEPNRLIIAKFKSDEDINTEIMGLFEKMELN
jgi:hypothetical protein